MGKVKIGDLFELEKGELQSSKCTEGQYDFITAAEEWKTHNSYSHEIEALIFAAMASGSLGRTHYVNGKFITSDLCYILTPKDSKKYPINIKFYHFVFNSLRDEIVKNTKSGTSKESINQTNLKNYEISYFDIDQQDLWIQKLLNTKITKKELENEINHQQKLLNKFRQSILEDAIEGKLTASWREQNSDVESASILLEKIKAEKEQLAKDKKIKKQKPLSSITDDEIPFDIPNTWEWCRLGQVTNIVRGGSPRPAGDKRFYDGDIPFLKVADLTNDSSMYVQGHTYSIKETGLQKTRYIEEETLMLTNSGATLGIPKICQFPTAFNDGIAAFVHMNTELHKPYFYYFLKSKTNWFLKEASRGQGQPNLNTDIIGETIINLPPFEEQKEITEKIKFLLDITYELEEQINNSKTNIKTLMQAVLKEAFEE